MNRTVIALAACFILGASAWVPQAQAATPPGVWVNSDSFTPACLGFTDNFPSLLYNQANANLPKLGYAGGYHNIGHGFTRAAFLSAMGPEYAVYVHSHGDVYRSSSITAAFWQDPASGCGTYTTDYVSRAQVSSYSAPPYSLVIMSTCYLGSLYEPHSGLQNMMPEAFGIPKNQAATNKTFYMGYMYETYDSSMYYFESYFFSWLNAHPGSTFANAFWYAQGAMTYEYPDPGNPFMATWFGDINDAGPLY